MTALAKQSNTIYPKRKQIIKEHHLDIFGLYFDKNSKDTSEQFQITISKSGFVIVNQDYEFTQEQYNSIRTLLRTYKCLALYNGDKILDYENGVRDLPEYVNKVYLNLESWENIDMNSFPPWIIGLYLHINMNEDCMGSNVLTFPIELKYLTIINYDVGIIDDLKITAFSPKLETLIMYGIIDPKLFQILPSSIKHIIIETDEMLEVEDNEDYEPNFNIAIEFQNYFGNGRLPFGIETIIYNRQRPIIENHIIDRYNDIDFTLIPSSVKYISINAHILMPHIQYRQLLLKLHQTHPGAILE